MNYTYETLDGDQTFELSHPMNDPALTRHPDTGQAIRRIITGAPNVKMSRKLDKSQMARFEDYKDSKIYKETRKKRFSIPGKRIGGR